MANLEHVKILSEGVTHWNQWRKNNPCIQPDLAEIDLSNTTLMEMYMVNNTIVSSSDVSIVEIIGVNFSRTNLVKANLSNAILSKANFVFADLREAKLTETTLVDANFGGSDIRMANFGGANLNNVGFIGSLIQDAKFNKASLFKADMKTSTLQNVDFSDAYLSNIYLDKCKMIDVDFTGADLSGASLVGTTFVNSMLNNCRVYGASVWDISLQNTQQNNLVITNYDDPIITIDNLEIAQFVHLLLNHKKIRDVLNTVTEKGVLLLGRFSNGGLETLQAVAEKLRKKSYLPMIFDFDRPDNKNYTETVKTLVGLSRFVIVDISGPSVPSELASTVPFHKIPFVPIIKKGRRTYAMFPDFLEYPWVLKPVIEFESKEHLLEMLLSKIIRPAEEKFKERQILLKQLFNN